MVGRDPDESTGPENRRPATVRGFDRSAGLPIGSSEPATTPARQRRGVHRDVHATLPPPVNLPAMAAGSAFHAGHPLSPGTHGRPGRMKPAHRTPILRPSGGVAEWSKAPVLKTGDGRPSVGSNPTPSAMLPHISV